MVLLMESSISSQLGRQISYQNQEKYHFMIIIIGLYTDLATHIPETKFPQAGINYNTIDTTFIDAVSVTALATYYISESSSGTLVLESYLVFCPWRSGLASRMLPRGWAVTVGCNPGNILEHQVQGIPSR